MIKSVKALDCSVVPFVANLANCLFCLQVCRFVCHEAVRKESKVYIDFLEQIPSPLSLRFVLLFVFAGFFTVKSHCSSKCIQLISISIAFEQCYHFRV